MYAILGTLCGMPAWHTQLAALAAWPTLSAEDKQEWLSDNFCDEVNLFLHFKDRCALRISALGIARFCRHVPEILDRKSSELGIAR